jgi:hypothetical protein
MRLQDVPKWSDDDQPKEAKPDCWIPGWRSGLKHCQSLHYLRIDGDAELFESPTCTADAVIAHRVAQEKGWTERWGLNDLRAVVFAQRNKVSLWQQKGAMWENHQPVRLLSCHNAEVLHVGFHLVP